MTPLTPTPRIPLTLLPPRRYFPPVRRLCGATSGFFPCFARRHVPRCVLTNAGFNALPISPCCFCLRPSPTCRGSSGFVRGCMRSPLTLVVGVAWPPHLSPCGMCCTGAVGDEHHFIFMCPALVPVQDRFRPLFAPGTRSLRSLIWQQDLREVVRFVRECFVFRSSL
jgi:hypothetical protein